MGQPYGGEIRLFAGNFAPLNWMFCDGSVLAISQNETLFNLIGTTYGGDGQTTFNLPDLRGRVPVHQGSFQGNPFIIGQIGGTESVTLTVNQIPGHSHAPQAASTGGTSDSPAGNVWANWTGSQYSNQGGIVQMNSGVLTAAGGGQPHDNMMPFLAVSYIISMFGIFPSQG